MTKKWHSHSLNSTFLNYKPQPTEIMINEDEPQRALFIGDLHGSDFSFIQQLILNNIIQLSKEDLDVLSHLAESTYIDQLDVALSSCNELYENIQHQKDTLDTLESQLQKTKTTFELEKKIKFTDRTWLITEKQKIKKQEAEIYTADHELFLLETCHQQKCKLYDQLKLKAQAEINTFKAILKRINILDFDTLVWLLGDEFSDRANCDWRMLLLRQELTSRTKYPDDKLSELYSSTSSIIAFEENLSQDETFVQGLVINSLLSNHGFELLYTYLTNRWEINDLLCFLGDEIDPNAIPPEARSLKNLKILLKTGIITQEDIAPTIESWIDSLHLLTYSLSEEDNSISIYSHAPFGLCNPKGVKELAKKYGIQYYDNTKEDLGNTIDAINQHFQDSLNNNPLDTIQNLAKSCNIQNYSTDIENLADIIEQIESFKKYFNEEQKADLEKISKTFIYHICKDFKTSGSLYKLMWNRNRESLDCPKEHPNGFRCYFVNGHDTPKKVIEETDSSFNRYECDHLWGKPFRPQQAYYQYAPSTTTKKVLEITDTHITFYYRSCSEWGSTEWDSKHRKLPNHYFSNVLTLPRTCPLDEMIKDMNQAIQNDMYKSAIPTILYGDECDVELRYLKVMNEYLPGLSYIHPADSVNSVVEFCENTNDTSHDHKIESPNHIHANFSTQSSPVVNDNDEVSCFDQKPLHDIVCNMRNIGFWANTHEQLTPNKDNLDDISRKMADFVLS